MVTRIMIDSNIYDKLDESIDIHTNVKQLIAAGKLELITTHIQNDQIADIGDDEIRSALQSVTAKKIPTEAAVWGVSKFDEAKYGDEHTNEIVDALSIGNPRHKADALIGTTAILTADIFVTEDKTFGKRLRSLRTPLSVLEFEEFAEWLKKISP